MPSRLDSEDLHDTPPTSGINPYEILNIETTASAEQIKSAYRRAALKHHPDKASPADVETAKTKFHEIALAYAILSDTRRRARYDATGRTEESLEDDDGEGFSWAQFYRAQYDEVVSEKVIEEFRKEYQGSEEEREAVLEAYTLGKGDMDVVFESVMVSDVSADDERFRSMISEAIAEGKVKAYKKFTNEGEKEKKRRRKKAQEEADEAEEMKKELGIGKKVDGEDGLKALILQRQKGRQEGFLAQLEAKYAPKKKGKGKRETEEPPEELFERNRAGAGSKKAKKTRG